LTNLDSAGGGRLTLTQPSTYTGGTTVNGGTLLVNNASGSGTGSGSVTVNSGATLGGSGAIAGAVTCQSGGILAPGAGVGTAGTVLTVNAGVTMSSGSSTVMAVSHSNKSNDQIACVAIVYGGTLTVTTNAGDAPFVAGDSFQLFKANSSAFYTGSFSATNLPALSPGLAWSNSLAINGSIEVISTLPVAAFSGGPASGVAPLTVTFTNFSSNATNYVWSFGDGNTFSTGSSANVTDIYTNAGSYTVILTAIGPGGTSALTNAAYIVVTNPPPVAGFSGAPTNIFVTQSVTFTDASTGSIINWVWNFGNGCMVTNSSNANVTNAYAVAGSYTVSLTVIGAGGSSTSTRAGYVVVKPKAAIGGVTLTTDGSMVFSGTNGPAGQQYRILTTTNVSLALGSWTPVWTNVFGPDGSYNYTNMAGVNPAGFFLLVSP